MKFVAVTSCPTGIAHTYMAAEALEQAAAAGGHEIAVETQGAIGTTPLDPAVIEAADGVIFAADLEVKAKERFAGKPTISVGVKRGVGDATRVLQEAAAAVESFVPTAADAGSAHADSTAAAAVARPEGRGGAIRRALMTGVSHMIPFVAAGGILIAVGFLIATVAWPSNGVIEVTGVVDGSNATELMAWLGDGFSWTSAQSWAVLLFWIGKWSFAFLVPALSGYIAYGIADRPGIAPGFVGGFVAGMVGAGFLGGIITGFLGGYLALWISRWRIPAGVRGIMPVVVIPLLSVAVTSVATLLIIGPPMKWINDSLLAALTSLSGGSAILLGVILGLMQCFDLGGPVNKVAYVFATTGLVNATTAGDAPAQIMAAVMAAGMVPPLAVALATAVRPKVWSKQEREAGKSCWLLGASFISEGAIPFAAADPFRMIPAFMLGGAVSGGLVMAFGVGQLAPHGGIWVLPLIGYPLLFVVALVAGFVVSALAIVLLRERAARHAARSVLESDEGEAAAVAA